MTETSKNNKLKEDKTMRKHNSGNANGLDAITKITSQVEDMPCKVGSTIDEADGKVGKGVGNGHINEMGNAANGLADKTEGASDFFENLLEQCANDPAVVFEPENINELASLKKENTADFERMRSSLKQAGVRITALDRHIEKKGGGAEHKPSQVETLIGLADEVDLFHTPSRDVYGDVQINGHRETYEIGSKQFHRWIRRRFYEETSGSAPNSEALQSAIETIKARGEYTGKKREVFLRVGSCERKIYIDLCNEVWQAVEIDKDGWRLVDDPPIRFRRTESMQALPTPIPGGSVSALIKYLNVRSKSDFVLIVCWALMVLQNWGRTYPVLAISGEQGSAKSTCSETIRNLLDPNIAPLRSLPRKDDDLFVSANRTHILAFDNISKLPNWLSDSLCMLTFRGAISKRQQRKDADEVILNRKNPIILNGIENPVYRGDLANRCIFLQLEPISEERRLPDDELMADFEKDRPLILGALFSALSTGLKRLPSIKIKGYPRMADFYKLSVACEPALWKEGTFKAAYKNNQQNAAEHIVASNPLANAIRSFITDGNSVWTGKASELLAELFNREKNRAIRSMLPHTDSVLSRILNRIKPSLKQIGIVIEKPKGKVIVIRNTNMEGASDAGANEDSPSPISPKPANENILVKAGESVQDKMPNSEGGKATATPFPPSPIDNLASKTITTTPNKAVVYMRVDANKENKDDFIKKQLEHISKRAEATNWRIVRIFIDSHPSPNDRKHLEKMIVFLQEHHDTQKIIFDRIDSINRSSAKKILDRVGRPEIQFYFANENNRRENSASRNEV